MGITENDDALGIGPYDADDPLLKATLTDGDPRLAVYRPPQLEVVLGRGSRPDVELRLDNCQVDGIKLTRRRGGGCAVLLDPGNVIVSLALPAEGIGKNTEYFQLITNWITDALASLGIQDVTQRGVSDLTLGQQKIGGSCIYRTRGLLYYSTTLLVTPKVGLMVRYLQHPPREPSYRAGRDHAAFVTSLHPNPWPGTATELVTHLTQNLNLNRLP